MLTQTFLKNLAVKAQQLRPVVLMGAKGLTDPVHKEIEAALIAHELIKIRLSAPSREIKQSMVETIAEKHQATVVQQIGHVLVLYRANPNE
jgi:RNA-binding protein